MPKIKYVGPLDEVEIAVLGISAKRNHQIDVHEDVAGKPPEPRLAEALAELVAATEAHDHNAAVKLRAEIAGLDYGEGLLAQDTWEAVAPAKKGDDK